MLTDPGLPAEQAPRMNGDRFPIPPGLRIFPLAPNAKVPRGGDNGARDRAAPDAEIPPGCNAGIRTGAGLLVLDFDVKKGGANSYLRLTALEDRLPATHTVQTQGGGYHVYLRCPEPLASGVDVLDGQGLPGVDLRAEGGHVVAPGSTIDGRPYKVTSEAPIADAPEWLIDALGRRRPREKAEQTPLVELDADENVRLAVEWLVNEAPEAIEDTGGDATTYAVAAKLRDFAISESVALDLMLEHWNETKAIGPWEPEELARKVANAYSYGKQTPGIEIARQAHHEFGPLPPEEIARIEGQRAPERPGATDPAHSIAARAFKSFAPFTEDDEAAIPRLEFVYGEHYARGFATQTTAPPKVGKSLLTLAELVDAASGRGFLTGQPRPPRRALYINFEDNMDALRSRRAAIRALYEIPPGEIDGRLGLISGVDQRDFYLVESNGTINEAAFGHLESEITRHGYDLVVLDPLQDASHAEESNEVFRLLGQRLRETASRLNIAIGIVHHTRKTAPGQSNMTMDDARGGSALRGSCRFNRLLAPMTKQEAGEARAKDPSVQDHRYFFRIGQIEGNMAPPSSELNRWFEKVSIQIANGARVGAVRRWTWPESLEGVTAEMAVAVREALAAKPMRKDVRSTEWVGKLVAEMCGFAIVDGEDEETGKDKRERAKAIVNAWLKDGVLVEEQGQDEHGKDKTFTVPGPTDPLSKTTGGET